MLVEVCTEHWIIYCWFYSRFGMASDISGNWMHLSGNIYLEWHGLKDEAVPRWKESRRGWHHYVMKNIGLFTYPLVQRGHLKNVCWPLTVTTLETVLTKGLFGPLWKLQRPPMSILSLKPRKAQAKSPQICLKHFHPNSTIDWRHSEFLMMHLTGQSVFL